MRTRPVDPLLVLILPLCAGACTVGPNYKRPDAPVPTHYKEAEGWKVAQPADIADRGPWWSVYSDTTLDDLEKQIDISNQTLKASEAAYRQALAVVQEGKAGYLPTLVVGAQGGGSGSVPGSQSGHFTVQATGSWDLDVWGRIRRTVESDAANAQASAADLAAARLSAQGTLASDYFQLRAIDQDIHLYYDTVEAYNRSLKIVQNQYAAGTAAKSDVAAAQTQLQQAQAQGIDLGVQRATLEHAIALLIGKPPAELTISTTALASNVPVAPTGVPSTLLQRRPDIAEAERKMQAANAAIGVATAAYYPDINLTAAIGYGISTLASAGAAAWAVGAAITETIFDAGLRDAQVASTRATYDESIASYRETVLTAFREVEDELSALRVLEQEAQVQDAAVKAARESTQLALNEYKAGITAYTAVITAQTAQLISERSAVTVQQNRLSASVGLIEALGGGWTADQLPSRSVVEGERPNS